MNIFTLILRLNRLTLLIIFTGLWIFGGFIANIQTDFLYVMIVLMLWLLTMVGWLYSAGNSLYLKAKEKPKLSIWKFRICILYFMIYTPIFGFFIVNVFPNNPSALKSIFLFHLLAMFSILYVLRFVAIALKTVEMKRQPNFSDYSEVFFSIWLLPLGIWRIQPRIQKALNIEPIF